jgi:hypothetical protein
MAESWVDAYVKCPFYKFEKGHEINCENIIDTEQTCRHRFPLKADKTRHMSRFCCSQYENCIYYRALLQMKYGDELSE